MVVAVIFSLLPILLLFSKNKKTANFCKNSENLTQIYANSRHKYSPLTFSDLSFNLSKVIKSKHKSIFCMHEIKTHKNYYMSLANVIDYKINTNKNKYRAKNHKIFIEAIAEICFYDFKLTNNATIFTTYKHLNHKYKILQKEHRVFKMLIGKLLIEELCSLCNELNQISKIINQCSYSKKIKLYKNMIYIQAEAYAFCAFNPNGEKLLNELRRKKEINLNLLFSELEFYNQKIKKICCYLKCMFN